MSIKVLVTGGTGMVGSAIRQIIAETKPANEEWIFVSTKDADLCDFEATQKMFEKHRPTHVINLAAIVGGMFYNMSNNLGLMRMNSLMADNVLRLAHQFGVKKCVSTLSTCIFPDKITYPIEENMLHNGQPHPSNFGYSYGKRSIDHLNKGYFEKYGSMFTSVIPCNVFGPHDNFKEGMSHALPGMIHRLHKLKYIDNPEIPEEKKEFVVFGTGKPLRQFIYSLDLAKLIIWVLRNYNSVEPIFLCVDEEAEVTIAEIAQSIANAFEFKGKIVFDTTKGDGQMKKTASNQKLRSYLPDFKFTGFDEGVKATVKWYIENYDHVRK